MRIVIDLQACQSTGSRNRGIGRYSLALARAMLKNSNGHEFHILLSDAFPETIEPLYETFAQLIPRDHIHVWSLPRPVAELFPENAWRARAAQFVREQVIADLRPDFVHIASLFEGSGDDVVSSIGINGNPILTAVTLYDLIPLVYEKQYLVDERQREWYYRRLYTLKQADLLLAISESSCQEGVRYLDLDKEKVLNISSAVDDCFTTFDVEPHVAASVCNRYNLLLPYVMYTGGIDLRKNIDGLISAFALLPKEIRSTHQLAIVCSVHSEEERRLKKLVRTVGLSENDIVLTGFVPDEDLLVLYRCCKLFVFPSWHEGFGLPALEAMSCGVPVIAANTSSLPEVLENDVALFDPYSTTSISSKMAEVLTQPDFAAELVQHGLLQAKKFSWDASATRAIQGFELVRAKYLANQVKSSFIPQRRKLAYFSPIPPLQSGIADYSAELVPALETYYEITLIVEQEEVDDPWLKANLRIRDADWYREHFDEFDRIIFHLGNSPAHAYMYELFDYRPGIIVLHDFFLGDSLAYLDMNAVKPGVWTRALYESHGYPAVLAQRDPNGHAELIRLLPCSLGFLKRAEGVIVHSNYSVELAREWLGSDLADRLFLIPHLRKPPIAQGKSVARQALEIADDEILVCSFGLLGANKQNLRLLDACIEGQLFLKYKIRLVFVGQNDSSDYGVELLRMIEKSDVTDRVTITGFASPEIYRDYLQAADIAVQLRTSSRGESSGTIFDCLNYGIPLIANKNGSISELPSNVAHLLDDDFTIDQLIDALDQLSLNQIYRKEMSVAAKDYMSVGRTPKQVAKKYFESIEMIDSSEPNAIFQRTLRGIVGIEFPAREADWQMLANSLALNRIKNDSATFLIDITSLVDCTYTVYDLNGFAEHIAHACNELNPKRVEFVFHSDKSLFYARTWARVFFGLLTSIGEDDLVDIHDGDYYFSLLGENDLSPFVAKIKHTCRVINIDHLDQEAPMQEIATMIDILKGLRKNLLEAMRTTKLSSQFST